MARCLRIARILHAALTAVVFDRRARVRMSRDYLGPLLRRHSDRELSDVRGSKAVVRSSCELRSKPITRRATPAGAFTS
jgi:hypothetical protein